MERHDVSVDRRAAAIAEPQLGLISLAQARRAGITDRHVEYRQRSGRWIRAARGVYRINGSPSSPDQRALAAALSIGDPVGVSYFTGASLAGLPCPVPPRPHVTVPRGRSARSPDAFVHTARLPLADLTRIRGIPVTTVARTLADCAAVVGPNRLQRMVDHAMHHGLVSPAQIPAVWDRARRAAGRPGEVKLRAAFDGWTGPIEPGSPAERRLRRQVVQWGFPEPELQISVHDASGRVIARIDMGWRPVRLGIEYDSLEHHGPNRWADDEARHEAVERHGWTLLHADKLALLPGEASLRTDLLRHWPSAAA